MTEWENLKKATFPIKKKKKLTGHLPFFLLVFNNTMLGGNPVVLKTSLMKNGDGYSLQVQC